MESHYKSFSDGPNLMTSPVQDIRHRELAKMGLFLQQVNRVNERLQRSPGKQIVRLVRKSQYETQMKAFL